MFERHADPPGEHAVHQSHFGVTKRYTACHPGSAPGWHRSLRHRPQSFQDAQDVSTVKPGLPQDIRSQPKPTGF